MLSRVADHLFWLGRYAERAENTARLVDVTLRLASVPDGQPQEGEGSACDQGQGCSAVSERCASFDGRRLFREETASAPVGNEGVHELRGPCSRAQRSSA